MINSFYFNLFFELKNGKIHWWIHKKSVKPGVKLFIHISYFLGILFLFWKFFFLLHFTFCFSLHDFFIIQVLFLYLFYYLLLPLLHDVYTVTILVTPLWTLQLFVLYSLLPPTTHFLADYVQEVVRFECIINIPILIGIVLFFPYWWESEYSLLITFP